MFFDEKDIQSWKEDIKSQENQRKQGKFASTSVQYTKPVTWRDVKQKEMEYHPILQKFSQEEKENNQKLRDDTTTQRRADNQKKHLEKYVIDYNIINLEKDQTIAAKPEKDLNAGRLMPAAQCDYNILTNSRLDDIFLKNLHPDAQKKSAAPNKSKGKGREFNIVSNKYYLEHDDKTSADNVKITTDLTSKFNKTHDYNLLLAEYYDPSKEAAYLEKRSNDTADHGKSQIEKLPPTIKNREMIIFDPTREVPEAIKVLDQKKKEAMKKYELRYKVEDQLRERDIDTQNKTEQQKMNRVNDKKFVEQYDKGFDIITLNDYEKKDMKFIPKPTQTKWEKIKSNANSTVQTLTASRPMVNTKSLLNANDLKETRVTKSDYMSPLGKGFDGTNVSAWKDTVKSASLAGNEGNDVFQVKEFKSGSQRAKEPAYSYADNYNQYCVPPKKVQDDFSTRTLPQIRVTDNSLKFSMTKTGGFKKGQTAA